MREAKQGKQQQHLKLSKKIKGYVQLALQRGQ